jgi:aminoglycoside phosphotransferase (APT) family kinase protein
MSHLRSLEKDRPTREWIESMRKCYPCETEIDRVLTRKMLLRAGPGYSPVSLETLVDGVNALLRRHLPDEFRVSDAQWMTGGASKLQMSFVLDWNSPGAGRTKTPMVLRMEPAASGIESSRMREYQMQRALTGHVPVPPAYWVDVEGEFLPYPAIICGFVNGVTKPTGTDARVSGTGTTFPPDLGRVLGQQFVDHMAAMHCLDWRNAGLDAFDAPATPLQSVEWQINWWERVWEEDANEDIPMLRLAMAWLRNNMPPVDHLSLVHGDFRTGNFLYDESNNRITALLDWETAHIGDRHEDIFYMTTAPYRQFAADGKTEVIGGMLPAETFYEAYEKASGLPIIPATATFYRVLNSVKIASVALGSCYRVARGGKTHQDVLVAWIMGVAYTVMDDLRATLEEVL